MGYFYQDWKEKKMFVENSEGQFVMNFGEAEKSMIENLEKNIDILTDKNGIPEFFVVPGENSISAKFDWCRVVSRRAERKSVAWKKLNQIEDTEVIVYLNRLSDLLWMLARDFETEWTASK